MPAPSRSGSGSSSSTGRPQLSSAPQAVVVCCLPLEQMVVRHLVGGTCSRVGGLQRVACS